MEEITVEIGGDSYKVYSADDYVEENTETIKNLAASGSSDGASEEELSTAKETLVDEIIRRKKLAGRLDGEDEIQAEREYLSGLEADRLKQEFNRAPEKLDTSASTEEGKKNDEKSKYAEAGL